MSVGLPRWADLRSWRDSCEPQTGVSPRRNHPPSLEAAVRRRGCCCLQLVLGQTGSCHLWLHGGVVQPRRQRSLCAAMDEGASRKQHAVSTYWYFFFFLAVIQSQDCFSWLRLFHGSVFQGISRLAADLHSTSMDAQKTDTSCWRPRLVIHKSCVSVDAPGSRRLPPADAFTLKKMFLFS